jgi:RNA polymerase sigma factor (TIGR02999 family)
MSQDAISDVTVLLRSMKPGDEGSAARLLEALYHELRRIARAKLAHTPGGTSGQTLQPTALVHEAYMRLVQKDVGAYENRRHFFFAAARAMQDILVEQYRRKISLKRGGGRARVAADDSDLAIEPPGEEDIDALGEALDRLETADPRKAAVVRMRYFAGLTSEETAAALDISTATVEREWRFARALLFTQLKDGST